MLLPEESRADSFTEFVSEYETRLRHALTAAFDIERGWEATAEALAYGWEHWDRVRTMDNPSGYLYRVGRDRARRMSVRRRVGLPAGPVEGERWVEPELPGALDRLSERQRLVVALLYGYEWSMREVADLLGVSKGTVQSYSNRGLRRLRRSLGVEL